MNYYLDTEFDEDGKTIELISIAIVCEDGRQLHAVSSEFDPTRCNDWVKANVLPHLPDSTPECRWRTRQEIRDAVRTFVGDDPSPVFWAYYAAYDWVVFCQLFGTMVKLPDGFPMMCMDLKQYAIHLGIANILDAVPMLTTAHDALNDALWNQDAHRYLESVDNGIVRS